MKLLITVFFLTLCFSSELSAQELKPEKIKSKEFIITPSGWGCLDFSAFTSNKPDTLEPTELKTFGIYSSSKDTFKYFTSVPKILEVGNLTLRLDSLVSDEIGKLTVTNSKDSIIISDTISERWYGESGTFTLNTLIKVDKRKNTIQIIILSEERHFGLDKEKKYNESIDKNITVYTVNKKTEQINKYKSETSKNIW